MFDKRNRNNNKTHSKKYDIKKKKIKTAHNFITNRKTLNAQIIEKNKRATQLTLHRNFMNELNKNNYKKR